MGAGECTYCYLRSSHKPPPLPASIVARLGSDCAPVGRKGLSPRALHRLPAPRGSTCEAELWLLLGADWAQPGGRGRTSAVRAASAATAHRAEPWPRRSRGRSAGADRARPGWCSDGSAAHTRTEWAQAGPRVPRAPRRPDPGWHDVPGMRLGGGGRRGGGGGGRRAAAPAPGGATRCWRWWLLRDAGSGRRWSRSRRR